MSRRKPIQRRSRRTRANRRANRKTSRKRTRRRSYRRKSKRRVSKRRKQKGGSRRLSAPGGDNVPYTGQIVTVKLSDVTNSKQAMWNGKKVKIVAWDSSNRMIQVSPWGWGWTWADSTFSPEELFSDDGGASGAPEPAGGAAPAPVPALVPAPEPTFAAPPDVVAFMEENGAGEYAVKLCQSLGVTRVEDFMDLKDADYAPLNMKTIPKRRILKAVAAMTAGRA
jgi:hypothetical protein